MRRIGVLAGVVVMVVVVVSTVMGEDVKQNKQSDCKAQRLCDKCLQTTGCVWCISPSTEGDNCYPSNSNATFCDPADIQDPKNSMVVLKDEQLTGKTIDQNQAETKKDQQNNKNIIQLKPQKVKLSLRKGVPQYLDLTYRRAHGYPVDLYYLMDLSNSMSDDKQHLAEVGSELAKTMEALTKDFTIGFGSFVDKVMMPFSNTTLLNIQAPCKNCAFPYSFRNDMKLSRDHATFTTKVTDAKISGNLDHPEGGFDALMQAMVCTDRIGWREKARHILVFSTDAKFHHAGDGRLAGVVMPNDEKCHLNDKEEYTAFDQYDYPSIGQINKVAEDNNINIIFAVLGHEELYRALKNEIKTSSFGLLETGSSNVVDLIRNQYNNISSSLSLTDNSTGDITIKYYSSCREGNRVETNKCDKINENDTVTFQLEITSHMCPENGEKTFVEVKTLEDQLILEIEFLCSCDCPPSNSTSACENGGGLECGVCKCPEGYYGEQCQCETNDLSYDLNDDQEQTAKCTNKGDTQPCSNQGSCKCGMCSCHKKDEVSGKYCECDKRRCKPSGTDEVCSGHGHCECKECVCQEGYSGKYCQCDKRKCIAPGSEQVCSGHGSCDCQECDCGQHGNITYTGTYCEDCLSCGAGKCNNFKDCVQCKHFGIGPLKDNCNNCPYSKPVESLDEYWNGNFRRCMFEDDEGCYLNFTYRFVKDTNKEEVFVQTTRQCRDKPPILGIVFSLIGAIVGIGVISLILWKIFTHIHDEREYAKFLKETQAPQFSSDENPLWIDPNTTTQNPLFEGQKKN